MSLRKRTAQWRMPICGRSSFFLLLLFFCEAQSLRIKNSKQHAMSALRVELKSKCTIAGIWPAPSWQSQIGLRRRPGDSFLFFFPSSTYIAKTQPPFENQAGNKWLAMVTYNTGNCDPGVLLRHSKDSMEDMSLRRSQICKFWEDMAVAQKKWYQNGMAHGLETKTKPRVILRKSVWG